MLKEDIMPGQGLLSEQQGETDSEQCKRKAKAFSLSLFQGIFLHFLPVGHLPFLFLFVLAKICF